MFKKWSSFVCRYDSDTDTVSEGAPEQDNWGLWSLQLGGQYYSRY